MTHYERKSVEVDVFRRGWVIWAQISEGRKHRPPTTICRSQWSILWLARTSPTAVWEDPGSNLATGGRVYHDSHCDIQPWARVVHLYCRSTQPSLRGMVKWVSAFGLSNNKMAMVDASYRRTHSPSRLAWSEGWRPPGAQSAFVIWTGWTLAMALRHDDSTIIIIIIIIICVRKLHCVPKTSTFLFFK